MSPAEPGVLGQGRAKPLPGAYFLVELSSFDELLEGDRLVHDCLEVAVPSAASREGGHGFEWPGPEKIMKAPRREKMASRLHGGSCIRFLPYGVGREQSRNRR